MPLSLNKNTLNPFCGFAVSRKSYIAYLALVVEGVPWIVNCIESTSRKVSANVTCLPEPCDSVAVTSTLPWSVLRFKNVFTRILFTFIKSSLLAPANEYWIFIYLKFVPMTLALPEPFDV